ncbi:MAG: hypothetical protein K6G52_02695 [Treponemataceae bacterium]|nr:hypothetical protein [Treponemataceae bacterium]
MKRIFLGLTLISSLFLLGCQQKVDYRVNPETYASLKNKIVYRDNKLDWTESLDTTLVEEAPPADTSPKGIFEKLHFLQTQSKKDDTENTRKKLPEGFSENSALNRVFIPKGTEPVEIYPNLVGFGSLDVTGVDEQVFEVISVFIEGMNKKELAVSCIAEKARFLKPVFEYDFAYIPPVDSFIVGKPFIVKEETLDEYQIPVRLVTQENNIDTVFFLSVQNNKYYIEQVYYRGLFDE